MAAPTPSFSFTTAEITRPGSLQGLATRYLDDLERRAYSASTVTVRRRYLRLFIAWLAERDVRDAVQVRRPMVERYQRWLFAQRRADGHPLAVGYQIQRVKAVEMLFRWAVRRHLLGANPASDLDYPRPIKTLPDVLSVAEAEAVLTQPDTSTPLGLRDRAVMEILYSTGMRRAECARLRLEDIDRRRGVVRIRQGKGHKDRIVPIGDRALVWLARYLDDARPALMGRDLPAAVLFLSRTGRPITGDQLGHAVRIHLAAAGCAQRGSCHLFRHTMATALHDNGCDVRLIQEILGHARLDTTALYTHVGVAHLKAAHAAFHPAAKHDAPHNDASHAAPHGDAPHGDASHAAPHGDAPHTAPHGDAPHAAPHGDAPHAARPDHHGAP